MTLTESLTEAWIAKKSYSAVFAFTGNEKFSPRKGVEHSPSFVSFLLPFRDEEMSSQRTEIDFVEEKAEFSPRTSLGKKLFALRKKAIQEGMVLLSFDEILEEVKRRRGELDNEKTNLS